MHNHQHTIQNHETPTTNPTQINLHETITNNEQSHINNNNNNNKQPYEHKKQHKKTGRNYKKTWKTFRNN